MIKRYEISEGFYESNNGVFVMHEDYAKQEKVIDALKEMCLLLNHIIQERKYPKPITEQIWKDMFVKIEKL